MDQEEAGIENEKRIPLTVDIVEQIRAEIARTGVGPTRLMKRANAPPEGLSAGIISHWLHRRIKTARRECLEYALDLWRSLPGDPLIQITSELRQKLHDEAARTGKGATAMMRGLRPSEHGGLSAATVKGWMLGRVKTAERDKVHFVLNRWSKISDLEHWMFEVTQEHKKRLKSEIARTGVSIPSIFAAASEVPTGLTVNVLRSILYGQTRKMQRRHYDFILEKLRSLPDALPCKRSSPNQLGCRVGHVAVTPDIRAEMKAERERTGISEKALVAILGSKDKDLLSHSKINRWINGYTRSAPRGEIEMVLNGWRSLPDANSFWER